MAPVRAILPTDRTALQPYTHVVERIGEVFFSRCTADIFEIGTLTITSLEDEREVRVYPPGVWRSCTVYDMHHQWLFSFTAPAVDPIVPTDDLRYVRAEDDEDDDDFPCPDCGELESQCRCEELCRGCARPISDCRCSEDDFRS